MDHIIAVECQDLRESRCHCEGLNNSSNDQSEEESTSSSLDLQDGLVLKDRRSGEFDSTSIEEDPEGISGESCTSPTSSSSGFEESLQPNEGECETTCFLSPARDNKKVSLCSSSSKDLGKMKQKKIEVSVISLGEDLKVPEDCANILKGSNSILPSKEKKVRTGVGRYLGIILALGSSIIFPLGGLAVKALGDYHTYSISVWRFQGVLLPAIPIALYHRCVKGDKIFDTVLPITAPGKLKTACFLLLRGIAGATAVVLQFYSLKYISMADSMVISFSTPVFVTLVAHLFLGEKCGIIPVVSGIVVLGGVGVITRPPMLTGKEAFDSDNLIGASLALGCMVFATTTFVLLRYLRQLHYSMITLFFGLWGTGETLFLALLVGQLELPQGFHDWSIAVALAVTTFVGQTCMTLAFKFEQAGTISLCRTTDVIFAFLWQFLFLGVVPDRYSVIGAAIVVAGILLVACRKWIMELPDGNQTRNKLSWLLK